MFSQTRSLARCRGARARQTPSRSDHFPNGEPSVNIPKPCRTTLLKRTRHGEGSESDETCLDGTIVSTDSLLSLDSSSPWWCARILQKAYPRLANRSERAGACKHGGDGDGGLFTDRGCLLPVWIQTDNQVLVTCATWTSSLAGDDDVWRIKGP